MLKDKKAVARTQSYIINTKSYRNEGDTSSHDKRPMCQIWLTNVKSKKKYWPDTNTCQNPHKFDLEGIGVRLIGIMNVRDTSSHGDRPM